jgi:hypothetical protein
VDARRGLTAIASELGQRDDGMAALAGQPDGAQIPPPRLLGAFDPLLLGWESRQPILGAKAASVIRGGIFRPFALVRGRAAATWSMTRGRVEVAPFGRLAAADAAALAAEASDVERFLRGPDSRLAWLARCTVLPRTRLRGRCIWPPGLHHAMMD